MVKMINGMSGSCLCWIQWMVVVVVVVVGTKLYIDVRVEWVSPQYDDDIHTAIELVLIVLIVVYN